MKKLLFLLSIAISFVHAQSVTINPSPTESALIKIENTSKGVLLPKLTTTQRTNLSSVPAGLLVYDTTTNSEWYHNGTTWVEVITGTNNGQWQINADNQFSVNTGKVGVGISPSQSAFEVNFGSSNQVIFGSNGKGISFQTNQPIIGFNTYKDLSNTHKYLTTGYSFYQEFDTSSGNLIWNPVNQGIQNNTITVNLLPMVLTNFGKLGLGIGSLANFGASTKISNSQFTKFGENSPEIKYRLYSGTTVDAFDAFDNFVHYTNVGLGIVSSKILKVSVLIDTGVTKSFVPPNQCDSFYNEHCYHVSLQNLGNLEITHEGASSLQTYSKPYKILIVYTD